MSDPDAPRPDAPGTAPAPGDEPGGRSARGPSRPGHAGDVSADTVALLYFEQMKQIITLSVAVAGGAVTLVQTLLQDGESRALALTGVGLLMLAVLSALAVQEYVVERLGEGTASMRTAFFTPERLRLPRTPRVERALFVASVMSFAAGLGCVLSAAAGVLQ